MDMDDVDQVEYNGVAGPESQGIVENENQNSDHHSQNANSTANLDEVKEQVSQGCLTRTWLLVIVWRSTCVLIPNQ